MFVWLSSVVQLSATQFTKWDSLAQVFRFYFKGEATFKTQKMKAHNVCFPLPSPVYQPPDITLPLLKLLDQLGLPSGLSEAITERLCPRSTTELLKFGLAKLLFVFPVTATGIAACLIGVSYREPQKKMPHFDILQVISMGHFMHILAWSKCFNIQQPTVNLDAISEHHLCIFTKSVVAAALKLFPVRAIYHPLAFRCKNEFHSIKSYLRGGGSLSQQACCQLTVKLANCPLALSLMGEFTQTCQKYVFVPSTLVS